MNWRGLVGLVALGAAARVGASAEKPLFFSLHGHNRDSVLWATDGSPGGTRAVKKFREVAGSMTEWKGRFYFCADDGVHGVEPWKTDGTTDGTTMLKDLNEGLAGSGACGFVRFRGELYFIAEDADGRAIWKTNGTRSGTVKLPRFSRARVAKDEWRSLSVLKDALYFTTDGCDVTGTRAWHLWRADDTTDEAVEVASHEYGRRAFLVEAYVRVNDQLYFTVAPHHRAPWATTELWRTDGTKGGTTQVVWFEKAVIDCPVRFGDALYFMVIGEKGQELWKTEGAREKTVMVKRFAPNWDNNLLGRDAAELNGQLIFGGYRIDTSKETQLWKSDGTEGGTQLVKDLYPRIDPTHLEFLGESHGALYFAADDDSSDRSREDFLLWKTDGTAAGTVLVKKLPLPPKRKPRGRD